MFVENRKKGIDALWLEDLARRHPDAFTAALEPRTLGVAVALLFQTGYSFISYQSF